MYLIQTQMRGQGAQTSPNRHEQVQWRPSEGEKLVGTSANAWEREKVRLGMDQWWEQVQCKRKASESKDGNSTGCTQMRGRYKRVWAMDWCKWERVCTNTNRQMQMGKCEQGWTNKNESGQMGAGHQERAIKSRWMWTRVCECEWRRGSNGGSSSNSRFPLPPFLILI